MDALVIVLVIAVLLVPVALLERTHRRTQHLSRMPFGFDLESDRDIARTLAEVEAIRARSTAKESRPSAPSSATTVRGANEGGLPCSKPIPPSSIGLPAGHSRVRVVGKAGG